MRRICLLFVMALAASASNAQLIHQYTFNDGTANDSVGSINLDVWNASVSGGTLNTVGPTSSAYQDLSAELASLSSFTMEAWLGGSWIEDVFGIRGLNNGDGTPDFSSGFVVRHDMNSGAYVLTSDNGWQTNWVASHIILDDGGLHQVVLGVTKGADVDTLDFFVDGLYMGSTTTAAELPALTYLRVGGDVQWTEASYDMFNIYDSALTSAEVAANYAAVIPEPVSLSILGLGGLILSARKR